MFIGQLFKILFFVFLIYLLYNLVRFVIGIGRMARDSKKKNEEIRENMRRDDSGTKRGKGIIELDKDQYKVE